jgi:Rho GDP-dissociation inhibitor
MTISTEEHGDINYTFDSKEQLEKLKDSPFVLKEACHYKIKLRFKVQHELVTGLKHVNTVYRKGIKGTLSIWLTTCRICK